MDHCLDDAVGAGNGNPRAALAEFKILAKYL
jgi:hypothetical protein